MYSCDGLGDFDIPSSSPEWMLLYINVENKFFAIVCDFNVLSILISIFSGVHTNSLTHSCARACARAHTHLHMHTHTHTQTRTHTHTHTHAHIHTHT